MNITAKHTGGLALVMILGAFAAGPAQSATPSDVFQVVDQVKNELSLMHEANGSTAGTDKNAPALQPRRPRHVLQKAREILLQVQQLRKLNGLAEKPVPSFPVTEITPADVENMVKQVLLDVKDLRGKFSVKKTAAAAPKPSGKTPTDVYGHLALVGLQVQGLGIPKTVPNSVYRVGMTINSDLQLIRKALGHADAVPMQTGAKRKKPKAVFQRGMEVMAALKELSAKNAKLAVPGGIVIPNARSGRIKPGHVLDLFNNILADVSAMKVMLGVKTPTQLAPPASGKTPSDVFDTMSTALALIGELKAKQS